MCKETEMQGGLKAAARDEVSKTKPTEIKPKFTQQPNEPDIGKTLLVLEEEDYVVNGVQTAVQVQGGERWFDGLKGGAS